MGIVMGKRFPRKRFHFLAEHERKFLRCRKSNHCQQWNGLTYLEGAGAITEVGDKEMIDVSTALNRQTDGQRILINIYRTPYLEFCLRSG